MVGAVTRAGGAVRRSYIEITDVKMGYQDMKLLSGIAGLTLTGVVALASANAADMYRAPGLRRG
jgi:hypothetical protein